MKTAILFTGQGSQYPGMGKKLYNTNIIAKNIFDKAGAHIKNLCFNSDEKQLSDTQNTQPSIFTLSMAYFQILKNSGIVIDAVAGFSVGEYSALCSCGVFSFEDGLELVKKRGLFMSEIPGRMAAVICNKEKLFEILKGSPVEPVNYNCPGQTVVAGRSSDIENFLNIAKHEGIKAIPLSVSGPFHSSIMKPAADKLDKELALIELNPPSFPIVLNTTGKFLVDFEPNDLKKTMVSQTMNPVLWEDSIKTLINYGIDTMIEVGPGKTLSSFVRKIDKNIRLINSEQIESGEML